MEKGYHQDTYGWALEQADALKRRAANEVDWDNVAEEIESLGKQQASELRSRYVVLIVHLLKWVFQPARRSRTWRLTIAEPRRAINLHLRDNPSQKSILDQCFDEAYGLARIRAAREMDLEIDALPEEALFSASETADPNWFPPDVPPPQ